MKQNFHFITYAKIRGPKFPNSIWYSGITVQSYVEGLLSSYKEPWWYENFASVFIAGSHGT